MAGLLLRSAPDLEPPPTAQDELWKRLEVATAIGAATGAAGVATIAAASGTSTAKVGVALWVTVLKWGAAVVLGASVVGFTAHVALRDRSAPKTALVEQTTRVMPHVQAKTPEAPLPEAPAPADTAETDDALPEAPAPLAREPKKRAHRHAETHDVGSALRAESALLSQARAKLASGDYRGALADVTRLESKFPRGRLVQEREIVAIDSLNAMGETKAARTRGQAFIAHFPDSPYAKHLSSRMEP